MSLVLKYICFVSAECTEIVKYQKNITLPQVIQLSIQISIHGVYFPGVLDYITRVLHQVECLGVLGTQL